MEIIDTRNRPNTMEFWSRLQTPAVQYHFRTLRHPIPPPQTVEEWMAEVDQVGLSKVVFTGRDIETTTGFKLSNDYLAEIGRKYPDRVIGIAGIDPLKGKAALEELERSVQELGLRGASMDPYSMKMLPHDRRLYPLYEKCVELSVPIFITIGPLPLPGVYLEFGRPIYIDYVATDFPTLNIVCAHGGWPYTQEMIAITWRHTNVYFDTSVYWSNPGAELVVQAANAIIPDKVLFATAHPFAPMKESLTGFLKLPFLPEVLPKVLYQNAADLLKLR